MIFYVGRSDCIINLKIVNFLHADQPREQASYLHRNPSRAGGLRRS